MTKRRKKGKEKWRKGRNKQTNKHANEHANTQTYETERRPTTDQRTNTDTKEDVIPTGLAFNQGKIENANHDALLPSRAGSGYKGWSSPRESWRQRSVCRPTSPPWPAPQLPPRPGPPGTRCSRWTWARCPVWRGRCGLLSKHMRWSRWGWFSRPRSRLRRGWNFRSRWNSWCSFGCARGAACWSSWLWTRRLCTGLRWSPGGRRGDRGGQRKLQGRRRTNVNF